MLNFFPFCSVIAVIFSLFLICHFSVIYSLLCCGVRVSGAGHGMVSPWLETPRRESPRKSTRTRTRLSTPPRLQQHCGQFNVFLRSPANKTHWQGGGGHHQCILWKTVSQCFYIFPDPESSHALFWRIPCTYGGQARCPLLPNWCNLHCAKHANTYTTKYNLPYHYLHRLQEKSMKKRIFWQLHLTMYHNAVSHQWQGEESFEGATSVCAALF